MIGVDIDLREVTWWCSVCKEWSRTEGNVIPVISHAESHNPVAQIIAEIVGPVDYTNRKDIAHNKRRWGIFNAVTIGRLGLNMEARSMPPLLVSPSSSWTHGYEEEVRQKLAKADGPNHDVRECQAMVWSFERDPKQWHPLPDFLANL